jgi:hypothetical protein
MNGGSVGTKIGFYQRLREHIPEEAARMIAEEMPTESQLATKDDLLATKDEIRHEVSTARQEVEAAVHGVELSLERLRASMFRWQLMFFVPLWAGVYGTLVAILFRGSP